MKKNCVICDAEFQARGPKKTCGKECSKSNEREYNREYRQQNKERIREYRQQNKERISERHREYYQQNKERRREYRQQNKERINEWARDYRQRPEVKERMREREQLPMIKLHRRISRGIHHSLKRKNASSKNNPTFALLDYTFTQLISHFESQFTDGMSWDNMGQWHIDHIRPVSSFDFDSADHPDFKKCWALNNLQPLWAADNLSKSAKWDGVTNA